MAHPNFPFPNPFTLDREEYVLFEHISKSIDINEEIIGIDTYYQHGVPAAPLFGFGDPQFIYLAQEFTVFRNDQLAQMSYQVEDENGNKFTVSANSLVAVGPPLWVSKMCQENFLLRVFAVIANIDYWEFVGWRLTLTP